MIFPTKQPKEADCALWTLQLELLAKAEEQLGPRDPTKKIYQPQFTDNGPMLRNTPGLDGAYTELSHAAENFWATAVFEMAHETVHLLNPTVGNTNYFEEGIAVYFSLTLAPDYNEYIRNSNSAYCEALSLVEELSEGPLETGSQVRERFGSLSNVSAANLEDLCPSAERELVIRLVREFPIQLRTNSTDPNALSTKR